VTEEYTAMVEGLLALKYLPKTCSMQVSYQAFVNTLRE
jgi:hypothetical protein